VSSPSQAEVITQFQDEIRLFKDLRTALTVTFPANVDTATQDLESDQATARTAGWLAIRTSLSDAWNNGSSLIAQVYDWVKLADKPVSVSTQPAISSMMGYWRDNGLFTTSRGFTPGAPAPDGGNIGTGRIFRLSTDRFGDPIETGVGADDYVARCTSDANTGTQRSNEAFTIQSGTEDPTALEALGAGVIVGLNAVHSDDGLLDNKGFDQFGGSAAAPTAITGWDTSVALIGDGTDVAGDSSEIYFPKMRADDSRFSLVVKTSITLTQRFDRTGAEVNQIGPLFSELYLNGSVGTAAGSITFTVGSKTVSVADLTTLPAGWSALQNLVTAAEDAWYKNFAADPLTVTVAIVIISGELRIDDMELFPLTFIADSWYGIIPGRTPYRAGTESGSDGDFFTWATTATEAGINQREFAIRTGRYFPTTGSVLVADAS